MEVIEDKFENNFSLNRDIWEREAKLFGDDNVVHRDGFEKFGYNEPSAPSVCLLYRAEQFIRNKKKFPTFPFDLEMTLPYPAFAGNYVFRQNYENEQKIHCKFEHEKKGIVASLIFEGYKDVNKERVLLEPLISYSFGLFVEDFFSEESRVGALLSVINMSFLKESCEGILETNIQVNCREGNKGRNKYYSVSGEGFQGDNLVVRINKADFVQKVVR